MNTPLRRSGMACILKGFHVYIIEICLLLFFYNPLLFVCHCRVQSLAQCLRLLHTFAGYYSNLPSYHEIFALVRHYAGLLPLSKYPDAFKVRDCSV